MGLNRDMQVTRHRLMLAALGGVAALSLWVLTEFWDDPVMTPALYLALFTFSTVYFTVALALAGPLPVVRALTGALMLGIPVTALVSLAGLREARATDLLDEPVMISVIVTLVFFSTPFLLVWLCRRSQWRSYAALFDAAWTLAGRYLLALGFVAVFWILTFLSNALLELVGIDLIDRIIETDWARFGLSGAILGLGLAVVWELRAMLSPYLFLRLLRLLVPPVLVVVTVFLAAIPLRGLGELFGELSSASTLMGAAIVAITLISTALDRNDDQAVSTRGMRAATRALAVLLPFLTGLAVWAVMLRVGQYGWTPDRVLAAVVALFLLAYGAGYAISVVRRVGWAERVRSVNVVMAMAVITVSALWMTPVLNPYRISADSQLARFANGRASLDQLAFWPMQKEWGRAGHTALARLEAMTEHPDYEALQARIDAVRREPDTFRFEQAVREATAPASAGALAAMIPVRPEGATLAGDGFAGVPGYRISQWQSGCNRVLPDGRAGCVFVRGAFSPAVGADAQGIVLYLDGQDRARADHLRISADGTVTVSEVFDARIGTWPDLPADAVSRALDGQFEIRPTGGNALSLGNSLLVPEN